jgi:siroheme synthase-like protein
MTDRRWYPLFLDVTGKRAVVVGGGSVAARKAETLVRYGAAVAVIAPEAAPEIEELERGGAVKWHRRPFEDDDAEGALLVIAATDDAGVNATVAAAARRRNIPVNVADATELCDFIVPAVIESGSIQIAVSTGGKSPALARRLRRNLEALVGPEYSEMNELLGALRDRAIAAPSLPEDADRRRFFQSILDAGVIELLREGRRGEAYSAVARLCAAHGIVPPSPERSPGAE